MILLYIVVLLFVVIVILWLLPGFTLPIKNKHRNSLHKSIASLEKIMLGGQQQWILIRGCDRTNPVILFLHGGPGTAAMTLLRKYSTELEKHFVVVSWDQRGAGKSYTAIETESKMNIKQFISDALELTEFLCLRFGQKKIFLAGHSWGSVLGILTVEKRPERYCAYIGIGQVSNMLKNEECTYEWTLEQARRSGDKGIVKKLAEIGKPPYSGNWQKKFMTQRRFLGKYGGEVYRSTKGAFPIVIGNLICSTEYSLHDKINFFRGIFSTVRLVWPELMKVNLLETAPEVKVPVYFVLGKHDYEAPYMLAEEYFKVLEAPCKEVIWFEDSAHFPNIEENEKFNDLLINRILPSNYAGSSAI